MSPPVPRGPVFAEIAGARVRGPGVGSGAEFELTHSVAHVGSDVGVILGASVSDGAGSAQHFEGPHALTAFLQDHRKQVQTLGFGGEVGNELLAERLCVIEMAGGELVGDAIGLPFEPLDAASAKLCVTLRFVVTRRCSRRG